LLEPLLGREILDAADPAIRMVWVTAGNPVAMLPEAHTVQRALETRELTVVVDSFLTDTARTAHVVLPTTTMLEDDDLVGAYGHHWLARSVLSSLRRRRRTDGASQARAEPRPAQHLVDDIGDWRNFSAAFLTRGASLGDP
jgi:anaerobic selenocysteine-containing dehydrogenase